MAIRRIKPHTFEIQFDTECGYCDGALYAGERAGYTEDNWLVCVPCLEAA